MIVNFDKIISNNKKINLKNEIIIGNMTTSEIQQKYINGLKKFEKTFIEDVDLIKIDYGEK